MKTLQYAILLMNPWYRVSNLLYLRNIILPWTKSARESQSGYSSSGVDPGSDVRLTCFA